MQIRSRLQLTRFCTVLAFLLCGGNALAEPVLRFSSSLTLEHDAEWFGGWSALEVTDGGRRLIALSDRGHLIHADMQRSDGTLQAITLTQDAALTREIGPPLIKSDKDAEGLAIAPDGRAFASFEYRNRITRVDLDTGMLSGEIAVPFTRDVGRNSGLEMLAVDAEGILFAMAEKAPAPGATFELFAYCSGQWTRAARIPKRGPFLPVGGDFDPAGRLWILERAATLLGFRSRIRLLDFSHDAPRDDTLLTTQPAQFDNLEGLSVWPDTSGILRVTMISDDNFLRIQDTQIVEFIVEE